MHESSFDPSKASPNPIRSADGHAAHLICDVCGDRIGVYERLWVRRPDGALLASSYLEVREGAAGLGGAERVLHLECLTPEAVEGRPSGADAARARADAA